MERLSQGEKIVIEKRGYASAGAADRVKSRATTSNRRSLKGSLKGSMKGSLKRTPSLLFAAADSESDDLTSCGFSDHRPRRQCSFVTRDDVSPEIMDLRLLDSEHGSGTRRSPYDLSVCSAGSFETLKTTADEKMGIFEVTLPPALKKTATKTENADHSGSGNEGDDEKTRGLVDALAARRRFSMETVWSIKRPLPKNPSPPSPQDPIEPTITKSSRKVRARRCAQAAAITLLLATFVVFPWLVIAIYFGVEDNDPSSLISSVSAKIPVMLESLFDPRDENEVHHELGEPPFVPTGVNRRHRHLAVLDKDRLLRKEHVARERQARIEAGKEKERMVREQRKRRLQKLKSLQEDEDNNMIPQDSEDEPETDTQTVKLNTFVY